MNLNSKINTILKGNLRIYKNNEETQVRGVIDHQLTFSNKNEIDFLIARKSEMGTWVNEESAIRDLVGDLFEDGFIGSGIELIKEISESFLLKKEILYSQERQKVDDLIRTKFNVLKGLKQRLCRASAETLKNSFIARSKNGDLDNLYRNDLKYLAEDINHLLDESEDFELNGLMRFFSALDNCQESMYFEELKVFCKN